MDEEIYRAHPSFIETTAIKDFYTYLESIDWSDPWLLGLIGFHLTCLIIILATRRRYGAVQFFLFAFLIALVYFSETLNEVAAANWRLFSRQQYFDSDGMFIAIVFAMPILFNCILLIGFWLTESVHLMANVKRAQLMEKARRDRSRQPATETEATVKEKVT